MSSLPSSLPRRRVATWWTSDAAHERQRLIPPWIALGFGALVLGGLGLLFPFRGLEAELGRAGPRPDALQIAYLEAWLTVRPDREQLRYRLAQQLVAAEDYERARGHLSRLSEASDRGVRDRAELLDLDIALRELQALSPGHPDRDLRVQALRDRFRALLARELPPDIGIGLAQRAAELGAGVVTAEWYERLLRNPPALPAAAWEVAARTTLGTGEYRLAARLWLQASKSARSAAEQRRLFIEALRTLQSASLFDEALALAEAHLGALATDTAVLEYLTRLALAAGRPDIAQRYAILLLRIALLPQAIDRLQQAGYAVPPAWRALLDRSAPRLERAQATVAPASEAHERTARLPFDDNLYALSYEVFIANGNLSDAIVVARSAVRQVPGHLGWRRKLAQAADWAGQPQLALEQWHAIARAGGGSAAWAEVRRRASAVARDRPVGRSARGRACARAGGRCHVAGAGARLRGAG
ncbi:MAG: hypothetical protein U5L03_15055 [Burkholderiaceae bacterium]|nr:hypothetical protein [Burkholderiaceae bacterium]